MLVGSRTPRLACYVAFVSVFVFLCWQFQNFHSSLRVENKLGDQANHNPTLSKEGFVVAATEAARGDDYDDASLREMCSGQSWDKSVVFTCHGLIGGIGKHYSFPSSAPPLKHEINTFQETSSKKFYIV